jgi:hypothetical protein
MDIIQQVFEVEKKKTIAQASDMVNVINNLIKQMTKPNFKSVVMSMEDIKDDLISLCEQYETVEFGDYQTVTQITQDIGSAAARFRTEVFHFLAAH